MRKELLRSWPVLITRTLPALLVAFWVTISRPFFFSSRRRHTCSLCDWSSDVCSSDLLNRDPLVTATVGGALEAVVGQLGWRRTEERRVGKECKYRGKQEQEKKKKK